MFNAEESCQWSLHHHHVGVELEVYSQKFTRASHFLAWLCICFIQLIVIIAFHQMEVGGGGGWAVSLRSRLSVLNVCFALQRVCSQKIELLVLPP